MRRILFVTWSVLSVAALLCAGCGSGASNCEAGEGAALYLSIQPDTIYADGLSTIKVKASGQDEKCNPLPAGTQVSFSLLDASVEGVGLFENDETTMDVIFGAHGAEAFVHSDVVGTVSVQASVAALTLTSNTETLTFEEPLPTGFCRLSLQASPPAVIANGQTTSTIRATITGDDGTPIPDGTDVVFETPYGTFDGSATTTLQTEGGMAEAVLTSELVDNDTVVAVEVDAICNDEAGTRLSDSVDVTFIAARPTVTLTPSVDTVRGDGVSTVTMTAVVRQSDGSPAPADLDVDFSTNLGKFGSTTSYTTTTDDQGQATAVLTGGLEGGTATVQASVTFGSDEAMGQADVIVQGIHRVDVAGAAQDVLGDGTSMVGLTATVYLSDGTAAWDGIQVEFTTDLGEFDGAPGNGRTLVTSTDANGRAYADFVSPVVSGMASIEAEASIDTKHVTSSRFEISVHGLDSVTLTPSAYEILADGASQVNLTAVVLLDDGAPAWQGMAVTFSHDSPGYGHFENGQPTFATTTDAAGMAYAVFTAGTEGKPTVRITAEAEVGSTTESDQVSIALKSLDNMNLLCQVEDLLADGVSSAPMTALALLNDNSPVGAGTQVEFAITPSGQGLGTFAESSAETYTTVTDDNGEATATFVAGLHGGTATITATATVQAVQVDDVHEILLHELNAIQYDQADYTRLGARGSGRNETSRVIFEVLDTEGHTVPAGCPVSFTLSTAPGEPTLDPLEAVTDENGKVWTTLHAGYIATNVTITARAYIPDPVVPTNPPVKTAEATSPAFSIVGAKPNAKYLTFVVELGKSNRPGFSCALVNTNCTVSLADRYSNKIGLATSVNFYIEAGAITGSAVTSESATTLGQATTIATTGNPFPVDVQPLAGEPSWLDGAVTRNPRDGLISIVASTTGEEEFTDENGNGDYDPGEPFVDLGEPFIDKNDNGTRDPGEFFFDVDGDTFWTAPNGVWDTDTVIWTQTWMVWSARPSRYSIGNNFYVPKEQTVLIDYQFSDRNLNPIHADGTRISATLTGDLGRIDNTNSSPQLPHTMRDLLGTTLSMQKVKDKVTKELCCDSIHEPECPALDEICYMVPIVEGFTGGFIGRVAVEGADLDTQEPSADVTVTMKVDFKECPTSAADSFLFSADGTVEGCIPDCAGKECGDDGCGGSCGTCTSPEVCNTTSGQCE